MIQSELRTLRGVRPTLPSPTPSYTQASADDEATIDVLTSEMESLLIDARLRAHPVISTMWERVADDARDRLAAATSPTHMGPGFGGSANMQLESSSSSFVRVDKSVLTSPPASPAVKISTAPNSSRMLYSRGTSPISPTLTTVSPNYGGSLYPPEADPNPGGVLSESDETATLIEGGKSRSSSPFTSTNASMAGSRVRSTSDSGPATSFAQGAELTPIQGTPVPQRSFGKSSGGKLNQKLGLGSGVTASPTTGPKFFTSAFSSLKDS